MVEFFCMFVEEYPYVVPILALIIVSSFLKVLRGNVESTRRIKVEDEVVDE